MATRKPVGGDDIDDQTVDATGEPEDETYEGLLTRTIDRLKVAVFDPKTPPRDLAALTRRLMEFEKELLRLREETGDGPADLTEAEDEDFDPEEDI